MLDRIRELRALLFERKVSQADSEVRGAFEALVSAFHDHDDAANDAISEMASIASLLVSSEATGSEAEALDEAVEGFLAEQADLMSEQGTVEAELPPPPPPLAPVLLAPPAAQAVVPTAVHRVERASELQAVSTRGLVGALLSDPAFRARLEGAVQGGATAPARAPARVQRAPPEEAAEVRAPDEARFDVLADPVWAEAPPVLDVADLERQGTVRAVLNSSFRDTLEAMIWHRLDAHRRRGTAPPRRANNRPHDQQQQNQQQPLPFAVPAPSTRALEARVSQLSEQLEEMQRMLRMSMEVTLDLQRSVRQEVAAALNRNTGVSTGNRHPEGLVQSAPPTDPTCTICFARSDCVLLRCGHVASCYTCAIRLRDENCPCPVCRAPISDVARIYFA
jgi:hypothetical protein